MLIALGIAVPSVAVGVLAFEAPAYPVTALVAAPVVAAHESNVRRAFHQYAEARALPTMRTPDRLPVPAEPLS